MRIAILSCFYPYRGGIAQFNANLYNELGKLHDVKAFNFKRQYPGLLFPGKTQYVTNEDIASKIPGLRILDSINPLSYYKSVKAIKEWNPDLLIMRYWNSFFAPSLGYVGRNMGKNTKVISILDNVVPHERMFYDTPLTKYFLSSSDAFVVLSSSVGDDLVRLKPNAKYKIIPHPVYDHFGEKLERDFAVKKLDLIPDKKNILFFGLIREYKGLDILIEAFSRLDDSYQLVIAGEPYGSFGSYMNMIESSKCANRIKLFTRYISDDEVPLFFSVSDVVVLPYRSATQSGISAVSHHFEVPMITTDVGGLKEAIGDTGTGVVADSPDSSKIADAIVSYFNEGKADEYIENIKKLKSALSWREFAIKLTDFYKSL